MFGKIKNLRVSSILLFSMLVPVDPGVWAGSNKDFTNRNYDATITEIQETGINKWTQKFSTPSNWSGPEAVYRDDIVYFVGGAGTSGGARTVYALEKDTGKEIWVKALATVYGYQLVVGDDCLILLSKTEIYFLNITTGQELFRIKDEGNFSFFNAVWYGDGIYVYGTSNATAKSSYFYKVSYSHQKILWKIENSLVSGQIDFPIPYSEDEVILSQQETRSGKLSLVRINIIKAIPGNCPTGFCREIIAEATVEAGKGGSTDSLLMLNDSLLARKISTGSIQFWHINLLPDGGKALEPITNYTNYMMSMLAANNDTLAFLEKDAESDGRVYFHKFSLSENQAADSGRTLLQNISIENYSIYQIRPIISDNHFFALNNDVRGYYEGKTQYRYFIYAINLINAEVKSYPFYYQDGSYSPRDMIHMGGIFMLRLKYNVFQAFTIANMKFSEITITNPYKTGEGYQQYLGQIHTHHMEDIKIKDYSAASVVERYRDAGYDFIAMTEHNQLTPDPKVPGITYINMAEEDTQGRDGNHILSLDITNTIDETKSDQDRINQVLNQGGIPILAHPNSRTYPWSLSKLLGMKNYSGIEGYNSTIDRAGKFGDLRYEFSVFDNAYSLDKYDQLLLRGKRVFLTAGDDYTPNDPGFNGGAIVVWGQNNIESEITRNIKIGNFYAIKGSDAPRFNSIALIDNKIEVSIDRKEDIVFIGNGGKVLKKLGDTLRGDYLIDGSEKYVRVQIGSGKGKTWSQPIYVDKTINIQLSGNGETAANFGEGEIVAETDLDLMVKNLAQNLYPDAMPPGGYVTQVYDFKTNGNLTGNAKLSLKIPDYLSNPLIDNLSIFTFNVDSQEWQKVPSIIDKSNRVVRATLPHFSFYVLSYQIQEDKKSPSIKIMEQTDSQLSFSAFDNESTLVGVSVFSENFGQLPFTIENGKYTVDLGQTDKKIIIVAEDEFGNTIYQEVNLEDAIQPTRLDEIGQTTPMISNVQAQEVTGSYESNNQLPILNSTPASLIEGQNTIATAQKNMEIAPKASPIYDVPMQHNTKGQVKSSLSSPDNHKNRVLPIIIIVGLLGLACFIKAQKNSYRDTKFK